MSQKPSANHFEWIKDASQFNEDFIKTLIKESNKRFRLEVDVQYTEKLHGLNNGLPYLEERMKIEKVDKLIANLYDKSEYIIHIRISKQVLKNHE